MSPRLTALGILATCAAAPAQTPQPAATLQRVPGGPWRLVWQGVAGRTYFVQQSDDLKLWRYLPAVHPGLGGILQQDLPAGGGTTFVRLRHTDQRTTDPNNADFDNDALGNLAEISLHGTDPFKADSDGDTLPDGWEVAQQLDPRGTGGPDASDGPTGDPDKDSLTNVEELLHQTQARNADSDSDGITDGGEVNLGTDPRNPENRPSAEWFILTGELPLGARKQRGRTVTIPPGQSRVVAIVLSSEEYPSYTGSSSRFNDILEWRVEASSGELITDSIDINSRHTLWQIQSANGVREVKGFSPAYIESGMTLTAPVDAPLTVGITLAATNVGDSMLPSTTLVGILPLVAAELHPLLPDSTGTPVADSWKARSAPGETNGMVEDHPLAERTAHREVRMRIVDGGFLKERTIAWTMEPRFVPPGSREAVFRGNWPQGGAHPDRFEKSARYGASGFTRLDQQRALTRLDPEGQSAIRANLAPVGFNQGRLNVMVEGFIGQPAKVVDLEVPAVVTLDPGHGGEDPGHLAGGLVEKHLALEHALAARAALQGLLAARQPFHRVPLTRAADITLTDAARTAFAAAQGSDILLSLHFGADAPDTRGTETLFSGLANWNTAADEMLAARVQAAAVLATGHARVPGLRSFTLDDPPRPVAWPILDDSALGNTDGQATLRACLQHIEFLTHPDAARELGDPLIAPQRRAEHATRIAEAIVADLEAQPAPDP